MPCSDGDWGRASNDAEKWRNLCKMLGIKEFEWGGYEKAIDLLASRLNDATRAACTLGKYLIYAEPMPDEDREHAMQWLIQHCLEDAQRIKETEFKNVKKPHQRSRQELIDLLKKQMQKYTDLKADCYYHADPEIQKAIRKEIKENYAGILIEKFFNLKDEEQES